MSVTMTPAAAERVQSFMQNRGKGLGLRLGIKTTGCSGLAYVLEFVDDLNEDGFEQSFAFMKSVGDGFIEAYLPIVKAVNKTSVAAANKICFIVKSLRL